MPVARVAVVEANFQTHVMFRLHAEGEPPPRQDAEVQLALRLPGQGLQRMPALVVAALRWAGVPRRQDPIGHQGVMTGEDHRLLCHHAATGPRHRTFRFHEAGRVQIRCPHLQILHQAGKIAIHFASQQAVPFQQREREGMQRPRPAPVVLRQPVHCRSGAAQNPGVMEGSA